MRNIMKVRNVFMVVGGSLLVEYAFANGADAAWQCTLLQDNTARLACFDQVYGAQLPSRQIFHQENKRKQPSKSIDLVKTVDASLSNQEAIIVFSDISQIKQQQESGGFEKANVQQNIVTDSYTPLSIMYDLDQNDSRGLLSVREHEPMYLIPFWYNRAPNFHPETSARGRTEAARFSEQRRLESKMQVSFKTKLWEDVFKTRADLWFGYTQKSDWQVYNQGTKSAPFRNTDYSPEVLLTQPVKSDLPLGGKLRVLGLGFVHQSNGQSRPESRSWNRMYAMAGMEWGKLTVIPKVWLRTFDQSGKEDDNPDINHFMGYGDVKLQYRFNDKQTLASVIRYNLKTGKGSVEAGYTFPLKGKLKAYVRGFHGYGESLIDYNHKQTGLGMGLMFNDWDGI